MNNNKPKPIHACVGLPILLLIALLSIPVTPILNRRRRRQDERLRRDMEMCGRFIEWHILEPRLHQGGGTLIHEFSFKGTRALWWSAMDFESFGLSEPPSEGKFQVLAWSPAFGDDRELREFCGWSRDQVLGDQGTALLTEIAAGIVPAGKSLDQALQESFPGVGLIEAWYPK